MATARRTTATPHASARQQGPVGYGPADITAAYGLDPSAGSGRTVAVVDAFDDPTAEADLAVYRAQWGLPASGSPVTLGTARSGRSGAWSATVRPTVSGTVHASYVGVWSQPAATATIGRISVTR